VGVKNQVGEAFTSALIALTVIASFMAMQASLKSGLWAAM